MTFKKIVPFNSHDELGQSSQTGSMILLDQNPYAKSTLNLIDDGGIENFIMIAKLLFIEDSIQDMRDTDIMKFWEANNRHKGEALSALSEHLIFRKVNYVKVSSETSHLVPSEFQEYEASGFLKFHGQDNKDTPVLYCILSKLTEHKVKKLNSNNNNNTLQGSPNNGNHLTSNFRYQPLDIGSPLGSFRDDDGTFDNNGTGANMESSNLNDSSEQIAVNSTITSTNGNMTTKPKKKAALFSSLIGNGTRSLYGLISKSNFEKERFIRYIYYVIERAKVQKQLTDNFTLIIDRSSVEDQPSLSVMKWLLPIFQRNFPEHLKKLVVFPSQGASFWLNWKAAKLLLDPVVIRKIFLRDGPHNLLEFVDLQQLPSDYTPNTLGNDVNIINDTAEYNNNMSNSNTAAEIVIRNGSENISSATSKKTTNAQPSLLKTMFIGQKNRFNVNNSLSSNDSQDGGKLYDSKSQTPLLALILSPEPQGLLSDISQNEEEEQEEASNYYHIKSQQRQQQTNGHQSNLTFTGTTNSINNKQVSKIELVVEELWVAPIIYE